MEELNNINTRIAGCTQCGNFTTIIKHKNLYRGNPSKIMVIGIAPGNNETLTGLAFSGASGLKLFEWLINSGIGENEKEIRSKVYFTSLVKCTVINNKYLERMITNCFPTLQAQILINKPLIIITLGSLVIQKILRINDNLNDLVGDSIYIPGILQQELFPEDSIFKYTHYIIPLPHPSGLSRWLNIKENKNKLNKAFELINSKINELEL